MNHAVNEIRKALEYAQQDKSMPCRGALIRALASLEDVSMIQITQALRDLKNKSSETEDRTSTVTLSLTDQATRLIKDLETANEKKQAELVQLQNNLSARQKEANDQLYQFKQAEDALKAVEDTIDHALQTRRAHQQAIQGAVEGLSYSQMISINANENQKRLLELNAQLKKLLSEADQLLHESITERMTQISDIRRQIAQSAAAR